jgi:hypothetical protein
LSGKSLPEIPAGTRLERFDMDFDLPDCVPEQISNWFIGKVPFTVKLPNYQESSGQEKT